MIVDARKEETTRRRRRSIAKLVPRIPSLNGRFQQGSAKLAVTSGRSGVYRGNVCRGVSGRAAVMLRRRDKGERLGYQSRLPRSRAFTQAACERGFFIPRDIKRRITRARQQRARCEKPAAIADKKR